MEGFERKVVEAALKKIKEKKGEVLDEVYFSKRGIGVLTLTDGFYRDEFFEYKGYYSLIFDRRFLKAFYGEGWEEHLVKMVEGEPMSYIAKFI